jgi:inner membrane protein
MASFGHVAVGLLTGRLHGGRAIRADRRSTWRTFLFFVALATIPDVDILLVALGASERGPFGHRGALHSLTMALAMGLIGALVARQWRWPVLRTGLAGAAAFASHTVLDLLDAGGKSLALFWPFTSMRFHSPWRPLPDAPRGMKLLSALGLREFAIEFALFLPVTIYALWPHIAARLGRTAPAPGLRVIDGASLPRGVAEPVVNPVERDPPVRSSG